MNHINRVHVVSKRSSITLVLALAIIAISSCSPKKNDPSPKDVAKGFLTFGTWKLDNLQVDNVDQTSLFTGMMLSFAAGSYTTTNGKAPEWPASGTWLFTDDKGKSINRDGGLMISIDQLTQSTLVLSFAWTSTYTGGRVSSIGGLNVFTFKR